MRNALKGGREVNTKKKSLILNCQNRMIEVDHDAEKKTGLWGDKIWDGETI